MSEGGFPQLDVSSYPSQVFWLAVCFVILYVLMSRLALPRITDVLDRRGALRDTNLEQAGAWNEEAEKTRDAFEKSLAKAQRQAATTLSTAERDISAKTAHDQSAFSENSRKRLVAAEQTIAKAKADALASLSDIAADIAVDMVQKIADVQVNKADAKKAVQTATQKG